MARAGLEQVWGGEMGDNRFFYAVNSVYDPNFSSNPFRSCWSSSFGFQNISWSGPSTGYKWQPFLLTIIMAKRTGGVLLLLWSTPTSSASSSTPRTPNRCGGHGRSRRFSAQCREGGLVASSLPPGEMDKIRYRIHQHTDLKASCLPEKTTTATYGAPSEISKPLPPVSDTALRSCSLCMALSGACS